MRKLNHVWLTLQSCFNMIIENDSGNDYKIQHMGKESLEHVPIGVGGFGFCCVLLLCFLVVSFHP